MEEYLEYLRLKFNYSENLMNALSKIVPCLIQYFGISYKDTIFEALANCEIHVQEENEKFKDYYKNYFGRDFDDKVPMSVSAFHGREVYVNVGKVSYKHLIYMMRFEKDIDFNDINTLSLLVHEICHLIKAFGRVKVFEDKIVAFDGLSYSELDLQGNVLSKENNIGFEEVMNCYDEKQIMQMILGHEFISSSYGSVSELVVDLMENSEVSLAIKSLQFGESDEFIQLFGEVTSKEIIDCFNVIIEYYLKTTSELGFNQEYNAQEDEIINKLIDEGATDEEIDRVLAEMRKAVFEKARLPHDIAVEKLYSIFENFTSKKQLVDFKNARDDVEQSVVEVLHQLIEPSKLQEGISVHRS